MKTLFATLFCLILAVSVYANVKPADTGPVLPTTFFKYRQPDGNIGIGTIVTVVHEGRPYIVVQQGGLLAVTLEVTNFPAMPKR